MHFRDHGFVRHGVGEYVSKADKTKHTNTIEGFFSIFKRGMKGVYPLCDVNAPEMPILAAIGESLHDSTNPDG